jgi:hypothetical protein
MGRERIRDKDSSISDLVNRGTISKISPYKMSSL